MVEPIAAPSQRACCTASRFFHDDRSVTALCHEPVFGEDLRHRPTTLCDQTVPHRDAGSQAIRSLLLEYFRLLIRARRNFSIKRIHLFVV